MSNWRLSLGCDIIECTVTRVTEKHILVTGVVPINMSAGQKQLKLTLDINGIAQVTISNGLSLGIVSVGEPLAFLVELPKNFVEGSFE